MPFIFWDVRWDYSTPLHEQHVIIGCFSAYTAIGHGYIMAKWLYNGYFTYLDMSIFSQGVKLVLS
jgi:hypothetical protein